MPLQKKKSTAANEGITKKQVVEFVNLGYKFVLRTTDVICTLFLSFQKSTLVPLLSHSIRSQN